MTFRSASAFLSFVLPVGWALLLPPPVSGQGDTLARVGSLVEAGRFGEGRALLESWLASEWEGAPRGEREEGIWLRALLTIDPAIAELDFRRLVVEYPGGRFSDQALLRLAQIAESQGEGGRALLYLETLVRDYPQSPHRMEARALMTRLPASAPQSTTSPRAEAPPLPAPPPPVSAFTLQLGAFASEGPARALATDPRLAGISLRVVQTEGSPLFRVRMGAFASEADAREAVRLLEERGFPAFLSSDVEGERVLP